MRLRNLFFAPSYSNAYDGPVFWRQVMLTAAGVSFAFWAFWLSLLYLLAVLMPSPYEGVRGIFVALLVLAIFLGAYVVAYKTTAWRLKRIGFREFHWQLCAAAMTAFCFGQQVFWMCWMAEAEGWWWFATYVLLGASATVFVRWFSEGPDPLLANTRSVSI